MKPHKISILILGAAAAMLLHFASAKTANAATLYGDANQDGTYDLRDLNTLVDLLLMRTPMPAVGSQAFINTDVNGSGTADLQDLNFFVDRLLMRITKFPVETTAMLKGNVRRTVSSKPVMQKTGEMLMPPPGNVGLSGAKVTILDTNLSTTTDADGNFTISGVPPGTYLIQVDADTNSDGVTDLTYMQVATFTAGQTVDLGTILLTVPGAIQGVVTKAFQSTANAGILVFVPGTSFVGQTNDLGQFTITDVPPGTYSLRATCTGYLPAAVVNVAVGSGQTTTGVLMNLLAGSSTGTLNGNVTCAGRADSSGVTITVIGLAANNTAQTLVDGSFLLANVPVGVYQVTASYPGYKTRTFHTVPILDHVTTTLPNATLVTGSGGTNTSQIQGRAYLDGMGNHSGISVWIEGTTFYVQTDSGGAYVLSNVPIGSYTLRMSAPGYIPREVLSVQVTTGCVADPGVVTLLAGALPLANAGSDQTIRLPITTVILSGSGTASGTASTIVGFAWVQISGPAMATIVSPTEATTAATQLSESGTYVFQLKVIGDTGTTGTGITNVIALPANRPPSVSAGSTINLTSPAASTTIAGTASDADGVVVSTTWSQASGPVIAAIVSPAAASTNVTGLTATGAYVFRFSATDDQGATASADVIVNVTATSNQPPAVNAGAEQTIQSPATSVTLSGTASDPDGTVAAVQWTQVAGPAIAAIGSQASLTTGITGLNLSGVYIFRLSATDNQGGKSTSEVSVTVNSPLHAPPVANAGPDQQVTWPTGTTTLAGKGSSADGTIVSYRWTQLRGKWVAMSDPTSATTTVTFPANTTEDDIFRLTVTDNYGAEATDEVTVSIMNNIPPPVLYSGPDQTIWQPTSSGTVTATIYEDGTLTSSYWGQVSGPVAGTLTIISTVGTGWYVGASSIVYVSGLTEVGDYVFRFYATDYNGFGLKRWVTTDVHIFVKPQPAPLTIVTQPASVSVTLGQTASFVVGAVSTEPISYQWQRNGADIPNATGTSYTTPPTTMADSALFSCVVSISGTSVASDFATMTVIGANLYIVVDLSSGSKAVSYPVTYLDSAPADLLTNIAGPSGNSIYSTSRLVLRRIPAGTFMMGSAPAEVGRYGDERQHQVTLTKDFYLGVFPVTQNQYWLVTGTKPSVQPANPVDSVDWKMARSGNWPGGTPSGTTFMGLLQARTGLLVDLPTEAQWEYACRAGTTSSLNNGKNVTNPDGPTDANTAEVGWYYFNSGQRIKPVGLKKANAWGLYDMHGNILEWCLDWYVADLGPDAVINPVGASDAAAITCRVLRGGYAGGGGYYGSLPSGCRSASRYSNRSAYFNEMDGFRVAAIPIGAASLPATLTGMVGQAVQSKPVMSKPALAGQKPMAPATGSSVAPLAGAKVSVLGTALTGTTDASGKFTISNVPPGTYKILVEYDGNADGVSDLTYLQNATFAADQTVDLGTILLTVPGAIQGVATRAFQMTGNLGILVSIPNTTYVAVTNDLGQFTMSGVPPGTYSLKAAYSGYQTAGLDNVVVSSGQTTTGIMMNLAAGGSTGTIAGNVKCLGATDHSGTTITVLGLSSGSVAQTGADGSFTLAGVKVGVYQVTASHAGYQTFTFDMVPVMEAQATALPDATLSQGAVGPANGSIRGTALRSGTTDHSGICIWVIGTAFTSTTISTGDYLIPQVPPGTYSLLAGNAGRLDRTIAGIQVAAGAETNAGTITLLPGLPPTAEAGANQVISPPASSVTLAGTGTDSDGFISAYLWTQIAGPVKANIGSPASGSTVVSGLSAPGVYVFQITVTDNDGAKGSDLVSITVNAGNQSPVVSAGADTDVTLPATAVSLLGTASDPDGTVVSVLWAQVSGPIAATIAAPNANATNVTGLTLAGSYVFTFTAWDNTGASGSADVTVRVSTNRPPVAGAGIDQTLYPPTSSIALFGTATDSDGMVAAVGWSLVQGPSYVQIADPAAATTIATGLTVSGTYLFRFTVRDDQGATGIDDMAVVVRSSGHQLPVANAGLDQAITLPATNAVLSGNATAAEGSTPRCQWTQVSGPVAAVIGSPSAATTPVTGLSTAGAYIFRLTVTDSAGAIDAADVTVLVRPALYITQQPSSVTITAGQTTTFNIAAESVDPIAYQWQRNGVNIPGATTTSYTTPPAITADNALFWCVVASSGTIIQSDHAMLTVNGTNLYMVIDISSGSAGPSYPVTYLDSPPADMLASYGGNHVNPYTTTKLVLRRIPAGTFIMGSPSDEWGRNSLGEYQHLVTLTQDFYIGVFDVTQNQYFLVTGSTPGNFTYNGQPANPMPTGTAPWDWDAIRGGTPPGGAPLGTSFCGRIRARTGLLIDMPTEAQWEYACRAGTTTALNSGKNLLPQCNWILDANMDEVAWYQNNDTVYGELAGSKAVGRKRPNAWGIYDMHGNLGKLCLDYFVWNLGTSPVTDPVGPPSGADHVFRCGRSAARADGSGGYTNLCFRMTCNTAGMSLPPESNMPPVVDAGSHQWIRQPSSSATLSGTAFDSDGYVSGLVWSRVSGPAVATIVAPNSASTGVTGLTAAGDYVFRLTALDNHGAAGVAYVTVTVMASNQTLTAYAGPSQAITQPASSVILSGTGADGFGFITSYGWAQVSGPSAATIAIPTSPTTSVTALNYEGVYIFRLTVMNNDGGMRADDVPVRVMAGGSEYLIVDISSGSAAPSYPFTKQIGQPSDLLTNTAGPGGYSIYMTNHIVLRRIPAGTFIMGSPTTEVGRTTFAGIEPQHQVTLTKDYYMGVFAVTQEQYRLVTGATPSQFSGKPANPVEKLSWQDVRGSLANWPGGTQMPDSTTFPGLLSAKTGINFDLPTEAQWEYACRAGTTTALNNGQDLANPVYDQAMERIAWYSNNSTVNSSQSTQPVGGKLPNAWGLYDMHGNTGQWVLDLYNIYTSEAVVDPAGPTISAGSGNGNRYRISRGGAYYFTSDRLRSAYRWSISSAEGYRSSCCGFRVAAPVGP
jgi:formylglycine-generating enzyme required for sulfatase activity